MFSRSFFLVLLCLFAVWMVDSQRLRGSELGKRIVVARNGTASFDFPIPRFSSGALKVAAPNHRLILTLDSRGINRESSYYSDRYIYTGDLSVPRMKFNLTNMQPRDGGEYECIFYRTMSSFYRIQRCGQRVTVL